MEVFPPIPLAQWRDSKETLHRFTQVIGKIRLASSVRRNHWWNVPFHVTGRGITTRPMGQVDGNPIFSVDFDFVDHLLVVREIEGRSASFSLLGQSVASFFRETLRRCARWAWSPRSSIRIPSGSATRTGPSPRTPSTPPMTRTG